MLTDRAMDRLRRLPEPEDYFSGASGWFSQPPHEILLFSRRTMAETMAEGVGMHSRFVLCVCIETGGTIMVDGHLYTLDPGQGILLYPFQQHSFSQFARPDILWLFVTFELDEEEISGVLRGLPFRFARRERVYLNRLLEAFDAHQRGDAAYSHNIAVWLTLLLSERLRSAGSPKVVRNPQLPFDRRLRDVVHHIYQHLDTDLDVRDLAGIAHLSASHLRRVFREAMGVSLGQFMLQARIHHAAALLHESHLSVSEIAEASGFESVYSFSRAFKRSTGTAPTVFRADLLRDAGAANATRFPAAPAQRQP